MAWNELVAKRGRGTKVFQDSVDPAKHSLDSQAGTAWHYQSVLDSGIYDAEVDLTPQRVLAGGHDGWRVVNNGWHYFLGQPNGLADGFVGFGGRQGDRWLLFQLLRAGYIHWPTRVWDDIGGAPDYDRANLTREVRTTTVPTTNEELPVSAVADWSGIWSTPAGGDVSARWVTNGNQLKEEITLNEAARNWIATNRPPATPANETYFGFVFRLGSAPDMNNIQMDLSYLERWIKNGVLEDMSGDLDFDDDDGTAGIEVQNALQEFLFFLPVDKAYVVNPDLSRTSIKLRKRIYKDGSDYYLLVGAKVSDLNGLPAGDIVFDPTVEYQVGASGDDGDWETSNSLDTAADRDRCGYMGYHYSYLFRRFTSISISGTIDTAYTIPYWNQIVGTPVVHNLWADDQAAPAAPTTSAGYVGITRTTTKVAGGIGTSLGVSTPNTWENGPEIKTIIQELVDSYTVTAIQLVGHNARVAEASGDGYIRTYDYDDNTYGMKLHIEYTAAGAGTDVPVPLATLVITGYAPTVATPRNVAVPLGTLVITGYAPTVATPRNVPVPLGTLVITGLVPSVGWSGGATVPLATLVITGLVPTAVGVGATEVTVPLATLVITGYAPSVGWSGGATVPLATLVITGLVPTAVATTGVDIDVPLATLVITGYAPSPGWSGSSVPPLATLIITGYPPTAVGAAAEVAIGAYPRPVLPVGPPPVDRSFPVDRFYAALDNEAQKMRSVVNQAYDDAEEEAEELKRRARYARDEALDAIYNDLRQVNLRMEELDQAKTDIRSMQMRRRLEDARNKIEPPKPKPKKKKDRTPKLTKLKKKEYKKRR